MQGAHLSRRLSRSWHCGGRFRRLARHSKPEYAARFRGKPQKSRKEALSAAAERASLRLFWGFPRNLAAYSGLLCRARRRKRPPQCQLRLSRLDKCAPCTALLGSPCLQGELSAKLTEGLYP